MKRLAVLSVLLLIASPALADLSVPAVRADIPIYQAETGGQIRGDYDGVAYSNMDLGDNYTVTASAGVVSTDDYTSIVTAPNTILMDQFKFVGGVANVNEVLFFDFYDAGATYVDSFGAQFSSAGDFIWTVNLSSNPMALPNAGFVQMWADDGTYYSSATGTWYLNALAPTIGTTSDDPPALNDGGPWLNHKFQIHSTPEPTTLALMGLGVLAVIRRR